MLSTLAPIVLFTYSRPDHLKLVIESLKSNPQAKESDLIIYSDAEKSPADKQGVREVRDYIDQIDGFKTVSLRMRSVNYGLSQSIVLGVSEVLEDYDNVIVLEDDLVVSQFFLGFMNDALKYYAFDDRVISIHGYFYPSAKCLPDTFFIKGADCWGWATWRRGWRLFNSDSIYLLSKLIDDGKDYSFDFEGSYPYTNMLKDQILGNNNSWAIKWYASAFLENKLTLYPGASLVKNIGNDGTGTHGVKDTIFDVTLNDFNPIISNIPVLESIAGKNAMRDYFISLLSPRERLVRYLKSLVKFNEIS